MEESAWIGEKIFCTVRKESAGIPTDFKLFWRNPNGSFSNKAYASPIDTASKDMLQKPYRTVFGSYKQRMIGSNSVSHERIQY
ncbi:hypothetical protein [Anaerotruncus colihominis]|uniref:hypothetical protein n=1 Tax=Anaerotruncus colihominis TaxID=169435 RepID=UPI002674093C|nr:hypothetical protein [Anaerotruncus colihominis]